MIRRQSKVSMTLNEFTTNFTTTTTSVLDDPFFQEPDPINIFCQNNEPNPITILFSTSSPKMSYDPIMI